MEFQKSTEDIVSLPSGSNIVGVGRARSDFSGQAEIGDFDQIWTTAKKILWL